MAASALLFAGQERKHSEFYEFYRMVCYSGLNNPRGSTLRTLGAVQRGPQLLWPGDVGLPWLFS